MKSTLRFLCATVFAVSLGACATFGRGGACPCPDPVIAEWEELLRTTAALADSARHVRADSLLVDFAERHPGTQQARETVFWRALYWMDPQSPAPRHAEALVALDAYVVSDSVWWYQSQATVLRHLAAITPETAVAIAPEPGQPRPGPNEVREAQLQQLRTENARLRDELERIRRRLATPPPTQP